MEVALVLVQGPVGNLDLLNALTLDLSPALHPLVAHALIRHLEILMRNPHASLLTHLPVERSLPRAAVTVMFHPMSALTTVV